MKPKKPTITEPGLPRMAPLARKLFRIGMDEWCKVDPKRGRGRQFKLTCHGQIAAWNAIAKYVSVLTK